MAASKAFLAGVPIQDICNAAGWSTPLTVVRFYGLDMTGHSRLFRPLALDVLCRDTTLGRDLEAWRHGYLVPLAFSDAAQVPEEERLRLRMSRGHTSGIPASACFIPRRWRRFHCTCFYTCWSLRYPVRDLSPILWIDCTRYSVPLTLKAFPSVFGRSVSFPRGTRVTYVTWGVLTTTRKYDHISLVLSTQRWLTIKILKPCWLFTKL